MRYTKLHRVGGQVLCAVMLCVLTVAAEERDSNPAGAITKEVQELADRLRADEAATTKSFGGGSPLVIPAAAFSTNGNYDDTYFFHPFEGSMRGKSSTDGCVQAPAYLPRGAEVFQIYASILDEDAGSDVYVSLMRSDNYAYHDADLMANMHSNGSSGTIQAVFDETVAHPSISLPRYHYFVTMCLPSADTKLYSVRVYFEDSEIFSDGFESGTASAWSGESP
jgi:hypothetical protein